MDNFDKICRICLAENNEETESVFNTIDSTGKPLKIAEMIMACAQVEIISGDELPDQICSTCARNTKQLYFFKIKCEQSDKTLRNRLRVITGKRDDEEEDIFDELQSEINEENAGVSDVSKDSAGDGNSAQQNTSNNNITADDTLEIAEDSLKCTTFSRGEKTAEKSLNKSKMIKCNVCDKKFASSGALKHHRRIHTGEKPYKCTICDKKFTKLWNLTIHKRTHTGEKEYACDVCKKKFSSSNNLVCHRRTHTGERPYECGVCKKRFKQTNDLKAHKRRHTGEKPYSCDVCNMKFTTSSNLQAHKRTHSGEKTYECDVCNNKFGSPGTLTRHRRTHTGKKASECNIC